MRRLSAMFTLFVAAFAVTWLLRSGTLVGEDAPPEAVVEIKEIAATEHRDRAAPVVEESVDATPDALEPDAPLADLASDADADAETQAEAQMLLVLLSDEQ